MGYRFNLQHGNIVVYLTTPAAEPPRIKYSDIREFLGAMRHGLHASWKSGGPILTHNPQWRHLLEIEADNSFGQLEKRPKDSDDVLPSSDVAQILRPLRVMLSQFSLYAMPVGGGPFHHHVHILEHLALATENTLVLFPDRDLPEGPSVLDALPAFEMAMQHKKDWPGVLFWTDRGGAAFVPRESVEEAVEKCEYALVRNDDVLLSRVLSDLALKIGRKPKRILHLSDLHFGSRHAAINTPFLQAELHDTVRIVDRVVITGDLFDNPTERDLADFQRFSQELTRTSGKEPVCIPGNHDVRWLGNVGSDMRQVAALRWSQHVVDDNLCAVFFGFNSAQGGNFARGHVDQDQLMRMASEHRNATVLRPEIKNYLTISLVHHHPYSFETTPTTFVQRMLSMVGLGDESFMKMVESDQFTDWCARWGVSVILHGHKHVPRYEVRTIRPEGAPSHILPAVGCGSSLGAEGAPMGYSVLSWDETRRRWSATFFESRNGGPFIAQLITVVRDTQSFSVAAE